MEKILKTEKWHTLKRCNDKINDFLSKILMSKDMEWHTESADNKSQAIVLYPENDPLNSMFIRNIFI